MRARVEIQRSADHPGLSLVQREGDPRQGVALAVVHALGARASLGLAALLESRLERAGWNDAAATPHAGGVVVRLLADGPASVAAALTALAGAVSEPIGATERLPGFERRLAAPILGVWSNPAEADAALCVGELGAAPSELATLRLPPAREQLERWRSECHAAGRATLAVVGPTAELRSAREALQRLPRWPLGIALASAWPTADGVGAAPSAPGDSKLAVALRIASPARALEISRELGAPDSELSVRLAASSPAWKLERVIGTTSPRGACVRAELTPESPAAPSVLDAAAAASATLGQLEHLALGIASASGIAEAGVLGQTRPDAAAAAAAWHALSGTLEPGPPRAFVTYRGPAAHGSSEPSASFQAAFARARAQASRATLASVTRLEAGQGDLWLLLASPCATAGETDRNAGRTAALVRSLAHRASTASVTLEPWVNVDGMGLLAHGPPADAHEAPAAHATRIATALGRALAGSRVRAEAAATTRLLTSAELGPADRPLWWLALGALAPGRPSWLEPRGTWASLDTHSPDAVEAQRLAFLREPLRLAALANQTRAQTDAARQTLERWLGRSTTTLSSCPLRRPPTPHPGEYLLERADAEQDGPSAIVAVAIPAPRASTRSTLGRATLLLLNGAGGLLDRAVVASGLAAQARASLLGGDGAAAFVIEIFAREDATPTAVAQVRALLERLAGGAASVPELTRANAALATLDTEASLDPRWRLVRLWSGEPTEPPASLEPLRRFHQLVFAPTAHVVVMVRSRRRGS